MLRLSLTVAAAASSSTSQASSSSTGINRLAGARQFLPARTSSSCAAPQRKTQRKRQSSCVEPCLELVVYSDPYPSCLLPAAKDYSCRIDQGILPLVDLSKLNPSTLLPSLQAVEAYVKSTLASDPTVPSPLAFSPDFDAFLERALELAETRPQGSAPYVLLLQILSHLRLGGDGKLVEAFNNYYQHFLVAFEDAVDREPKSLTPTDYVTLFNAWSCIDLPVLPIKGHAFATNLKALLARSAFSVMECAQLLDALSAIKARHPRYRICSYQLSDLAACLALRAGRLPDEMLLRVAQAPAVFAWPTDQSLLPVLDSVCREAVRREHGPSAEAAAAVLEAAIASATAMRPRLGTELEGRLLGWRQAEAEAAASLA